MNYGLYISTSGALNATYRQDLYTSNLANVNTVGFKPDLATTRQRDPARIEDGLGYLPSNDLIERLGAGVMSDRTRTDFSQGVIRSTGNDLDLAIRGDGFFTLLDQQDKSLNRFRLTRDGRFTRNAGGQMVSVTSGMPLVGTDGNPVRLASDSPVTIQPDGTIIQDGTETGKIGFVEITNRNALTKGPDGYFVADVNQMANRRQATGHIEQRAVEEAAVNEIAMLMKIEGAARDAQGNIGMIGYHDRMLNQVINRFARVG
jgi:flagellar basal-body rod protein FlgF